MERQEVFTINGRKYIGKPMGNVYSKWIEEKHRLRKFGGAITIDRKILDDWPECEGVLIEDRSVGKWYYASAQTIRENNTLEDGHWWNKGFGDQYVIKRKFWEER